MQQQQQPQYNLTMTFCRATEMKKCAREDCGKTVYPMEELNCLDKTWHKGCFRCTHCGMALNMKNYKGYNKMPYCDPHYPKITSTVVADTPEMQRVKTNTDYQSQHKYHEQYEKMKGQKIDLGLNDPEVARHLNNTKVQSNVQYHGELERKKKQEAARPTEDPDAPQPNSQQQQPLKVGSIADYDPLGAEKKAEQPSPAKSPNVGGGNANFASPATAADDKSTKKAGTKKTTKTTGYSVRALYDYKAADSDEIGFKEGDVIVNCQSVDEGWLTGTHQKTLEHGMLPANYVEKIVEKTGQFRMS